CRRPWLPEPYFPVSPSDTGIRQARAKTDRLDAGEALGGGVTGRCLDAGPPDVGDAPAPVASLTAGVGAQPGQERDPRGTDAPARRPSTVRRPVRRERPQVALRAS